MNETEQEILTKLSIIENLLRGYIERPLSFSEASEHLGISKSYLYKMTCKNTIPHYKPTGKRIYFEICELNRWMLTNPVVKSDF